ncbi:Spo0B domain-containing protein [Paenibacillus sp. MER TA 81-3]|uniref:Spo0B domain-containing protein n=1 Tax=Paenibacillus sp. MER TA 81-3 TaxID=2939573 RepID=UPI002040F0EC|nr:Spo0B domain-containing protein [Paenibacillus sp. MER TA 81-3]MCM3337595.1 Spo0B domain-containing protein [Paenibacillus sp. MER TA 81-3]
MDMNGIRKSHPEPDNIGKPFAGGDEKEVLRGNEHVSYGEGTLGTSLRAFMPVRTDDGMQVGAGSDGCVLKLLRKTLYTGEPILDAELQMQGLTVWANSVPIRVHDTTVGVIATFRDKTEIRRLAERLTGVRLYSDALRAQTHEFMNKLHVILGLVHIGAYERLEGYIGEVASRHQKESGFMLRRVNVPVLAAFLLGKKSNARERGGET